MSVSTTADIITTQKKALVETIKVAERTELMRMKKLSLVTTSGERESLSRRFERVYQGIYAVVLDMLEL
jgi:hypothetical protein